MSDYAICPSKEEVPDKVLQRREEFLFLISAFSEGCYNAGWLNGIEREIRERGTVYLAMAIAAGGWPKGYRGEDGWEPVSRSEMMVWAEIVLDGLRYGGLGAA